MKQFFIFTLIIAFATLSFAQQTNYTIPFASGSVLPAVAEKGAKLSQQLGNSPYLVLQFNSLPDKEAWLSLEKEGITSLQYLGGQAFLVKASNKTVIAEGLRGYSMRTAFALSLQQRMTASLYLADYPKHAVIKPNTVDIVVMLPLVDCKAGVDFAQAIKGIDNSIEIVDKRRLSAGFLTLRCGQDRVKSLMEIAYFILYAQAIAPRANQLNKNNRALEGAGALSRASGLNLDGTGITIAIGDGGATDHIDYRGRTTHVSGFAADGHASHVAGTLVGAGLLDGMGKGMAPKALLVSDYYENVITNAPNYLTEYNATLTNNSWGNSSFTCPTYGYYTAESNFTDQQIEAGANDDLLHIFAAGNSGQDNCLPSYSGFGTVFEAYQASKNSLVVGNMEYTGSIDAYSSKGPMIDGRLKPEIVAFGSGTWSTNVIEGYSYNGGTSMSAPVITGTLALVQQRYKNTHSGARINGALLKALAMNTADERGNAGPDYTFGFGCLDAQRAVAVMDANQYFSGTASNASSTNHTITVPTGARRLKVMLYWADKAASLLAAPALVNDLDLTVNGVLPLVLNPAVPTAVATNGVDHLNNVEQVVIENPAAGTYTANVAGFSVPMGTQPYYIVYEIVMPTVTLTSLNGEEVLGTNPSIYETEIIYWQANDADTNPFTLDYSLDGGSTWTTISSTIAATDRRYDWVKPTSIASSQCRMRITRNTTANTDMSDANFTIIGIPIVTYTKPCPGYLQLAWSAIPGATSYEIQQVNPMTGALMSLGTTTGTTFIAENQSSTALNYVQVRALGTGIVGRYSVATGQIANGSGCSAATFNNNLSLEPITTFAANRANTSTALGATETITLRVRNRDNVAYTGSVVGTYQINGGATISQTFAITSLAVGSAVVFSFTTPANLSATGTYSIVETLAVTGDGLLANNTVTTTVIHAPNPVVTLPYLNSFEALPALEQVGAKFAVGDDLDFNTTSVSRGRLRTRITSTNARTGTRALTLDAFSYSASTATNEAVVTVNLSSFTTADLRLGFWYKQHQEEAHGSDRVWIRGNSTAAWVQVYDLFANQALPNLYKQVDGINIKQLLAAAMPAQTVSSSFQVKFVQEGNGQQGNTIYGDGYSFDDLRIEQVTNDLTIKSIDAPAGCTGAAGSSVTVTIENTTANAIPSTSLPISYTITDPLNVATTANETVTIALAPYSTQSYTFATPYTFSQNGLYTLQVNSVFSDDISSNNSVTIKRGLNDGAISSFPYLQGFESGTGGWYHAGTNDDWVLGTPTKAHLRRAANGSNCFATKLSGNYSNNQDSYLYSPCFDLTSLTTPTLSFSFQHDIEYCPSPAPCDFVNIEYSLDGKSWNRLGTNGATGSTRWYNEAVQGWTDSDTTWHVTTLPIPTAAKSASTRFRWRFHSDPFTGGEGVGLDDVHLFDKQSIYAGASTTVTQSISGSNWITVATAGNVVAQINPQGNNLGATVFKPYIYTPVGVRNDGKQYYMDRNIVIQPTTQPTSSVKLRFFFLKTEIDEVINGTGCVPCYRPSDAYLLGITKYGSNPIAEDDNITNNGPPGIVTFIPRSAVDIIPYDNGYYAEFSVNSFSEFWANDGGSGGTLPLPVELTRFEVTRQKANAVLYWETASELNNDRFEIEVARSDRDAQANNWAKLGEVKGFGTTSTPHTYGYTDTELDKIGTRYYRLRQVDYDGRATYSAIKSVHFAGRDDWSVYPNPTTGIVRVDWKGEANEGVSLQLVDVLGQSIVTKTVVSTGSKQAVSLDVSSYQLAAGIYNLIITTDSGNQFTHAIIKTEP